jgi:hypothetical protein
LATCPVEELEAGEDADIVAVIAEDVEDEFLGEGEGEDGEGGGEVVAVREDLVDVAKERVGGTVVDGEPSFEGVDDVVLGDWRCA